jgi:hypothetical protein
MIWDPAIEVPIRFKIMILTTLADAVPNVGTKSGEREEEEGMNDPRAPRGVYIVGREGVGGRP